ncbi:alpha/beta hydrolase [Ruegeria sp. SCPT10]|uniref:alpha/beta fold hydrolase n=1 Tax=Ruegeria sp. SCP10 TaxID=3141377 RepID=UPI00333769A8
MPDFRTSDGRRLYFEQSGSGDPVLCLSGLTRNSGDFSFVQPHLNGMQLIMMDYRGRGRSDRDPDFMNYNIFRESLDAIELLNHLGVEKTAILGTSRGGLIAMALAASHPDRLTHVILNDVGPVIEPSGIAKIMDYVGKAPISKTYEEAARVLQAVMEPQFPGVPYERWLALAKIQYSATPEGLTLQYDPALRTALLEQAAAGAIPDMWIFYDALKDIPTGVLRGANSDVLSAETLAEMHKRHPELISAEVPNRGHVPFLDEPESLALIHKVLSTT